MQLFAFNIEKKAEKKVREFLEHLAREAGIEPGSAMLIIKQNDQRLCLHLYEGRKFLRLLELEEISRFFGFEHTPEISRSVESYVRQLASENQVEPATVEIMIREKDGKPGAYLFNGFKYIRPIRTLDLLNHFNPYK